MTETWRPKQIIEYFNNIFNTGTQSYKADDQTFAGSEKHHDQTPNT